MRFILIINLTLFYGFCTGQLIIQSGVQLLTEGSPQLIIQDLDWQQDGDFVANESNVIFMGNQSTSVEGPLPVFYQMTLQKDQAELRLASSIVVVADSLNFGKGLLDLYGTLLDLGTTGQLVAESESSRAYSSVPGGQIQRTTTLNAPQAADPGNLGLAITSTQNLGLTDLRRSHDALALIGGSGIKRTFEVSPANNQNLDATLAFSYFDAELNGRDENLLDLYSSNAPVVGWSLRGASTRDAVNNVLTLNGVDELRYWTASSMEVVSSTDLPPQVLAMEIYPNPANRKAWLLVDLPQVEQLHLSLVDMRGRRVWQLALVGEVGKQEIALDISQQAEGVYTLLVKGQHWQRSLSLLVK